MRTSETVFEIFKALADAQGEIDGAKKDSANPFFKSSYADLASVIQAIKEPYKKNGLAFIQSASGLVLITRLVHKSGEWIETDYPLSFKDIHDAQKVGSAVTYAKRYGLQAATGVASIDDDGNEASKAPEKTESIKNSAQIVQKPSGPVKQTFSPPPDVQARMNGRPSAVNSRAPGPDLFKGVPLPDEP